MSTEEYYKTLERELSHAKIETKRVSRLEIRAPDSQNGRFTAGQKVAGFTLKRDNRDIPGMVQSIKAVGRIMEPLVCWLNPQTNDLELRRGFRRLNGANAICLMEPTSELAHELAELPVTVYSGISREASMLLVNDQTSLQFSRSEVYSMFAKEIKGGANWKVLCRQWFAQLGRISGSEDKVAEVLRENDQAKRDKLVDDWMNNFGNQFWGNSVKAGPYVESIVLAGYLEDDGLIEPVAEGEKKRDRINSKAMKAVWKAFQADTAAGEYDRTVGYGPRMLEAIAAANKPKEASATPARNRKSSEELEALINLNAAGNRKLVPAILGMAFVGGNAADEVAIVNMFEDNATAFAKVSSALKPEIRDMISLAMFGNTVAFTEFLKAQTVPETAPEPRQAVAEIEPPMKELTAPTPETAPAEPAPAAKGKRK